ncbi:aldehyde dehydrogenase [Epithele typhae]|uniref:aldehyde dehydrogenase n=1 Tax=Epithele typhae TaxID=378194 RepID=UPI002008ADA9|nr:aldehyde dehydrogenase [Epithele typhae]KAH9940865.1 aldehyde dehydrogenase [Epithele typhae]
MSPDRLPFTSLFIDGTWRPSSTGATFPVHAPSSTTPVGTAASASPPDCAAAIAAAARAFPAWESTPLSSRRDVFLRAADRLAAGARRGAVVAAAAAETGATAELTGAMHDLQAHYLRDVAALGATLRGETFPSSVPGGQAFAHRRAFGVVLAIAPWNAPFNLTIRAFAVPIMWAEECPRVQAMTVEIFEEAGLPKGVLNFLPVSKEDSPARVAEMIAHPLVRKVNFCGGARVGSIIAQEAAKYLKPCVMELGGKTPAVVLADADIPRAARAITSSALMNAGQVCMSTERVIVHKDVEAALIQELTQLFKQVKIGDPERDPSAVLSGLFTQASAERVVELMKDAVASGAQVVTGDLTRQEGVIQPHILRDVKPGMALWEKESFGPVIVFAVANTEAVDLANASEYSLSASLWTRDVYLAHRIGARIRANCVNINGPTVHAEWQRSMGGLGGMSGYGHFDVEDWTQSRLLVLHPEQEHPYPVVSLLE